MEEGGRGGKTDERKEKGEEDVKGGRIKEEEEEGKRRG